MRQVPHRPFRVALAFTALFVWMQPALAAVAPAAAQETAPSEPQEPVAVGQTAEFVAIAGATVSVDGRTYRGRLDVSRQSGSKTVQVTNVVPLEDYLRGVQEMDPSWARAALEAQAVAARSLVLAAGDASSRDGQALADEGFGVPTYRGVSAETQAWSDAVGGTRGRVLEYGGRAATAHYHATAGGLTTAGGPALPYLRQTDTSAAESVYPLYRWTTRISAASLRDVLGAEGVSMRGAITAVAVDQSSGAGAQAVISTDAGETLRLPITRFVDTVNTEAPRRYPDSFPPPLEAAGETFDLGLVGPGDAEIARDIVSGSMPATLPSYEFTVRADGDELVFEGRGWGHGLGMSKLAAKDFAEAGGTTEDILGRFYPGAGVTTRDDGGDVRVLVAEAPEVTFKAENGFMRIESSGDPVVRATHETWRVRPSGDDGIELLGPPGFDAPLTFADFSVPLRVVENRRLPVEFRLNRPAEVTVHIDGPVEGGQYRNEERRLGIVAAGERQSMALDGVGPGSYRVTIEAHDGNETVSAGPLTMDVAEARRGPTVAGALGLLVLCAVLAVLAVQGHGRRRRDRARARRIAAARAGSVSSEYSA